ncbi:hypothetical protein B0H12DRAFT_345125 [Mycena haematopus]|nr:hypothetical protein B0H12DRAFT_345125 [Mycena haematopus]
MVCSKCSNPSGALKCSRCRVTAYCNRECQVADWPSHKLHCKRFEMSPQKLELHFTIGNERITFLEDIPVLFCRPDAPRDLTSRWISNLVDTHEAKVLAQYPGQCIYCPKPAVGLKTTLMVTLHGKPPTVLALAHHLCSKKRDSPCAIKAEDALQQGLDAPDFPGGEVYTEDENEGHSGLC